MSTALLSDDYISFPEASRLLPGRPHISTLHRWRLNGLKGIRLDTILVGGRRYVSKRHLRLFVQRLSETCEPQASGTSTSRTRRRKKEIATADRLCKAEGL